MKRRKFIKNTVLTAASSIATPYILPAGRLFAPTGTRIANHVVFVLFAGGIRNQESVDQQYIANQGMNTEGNLMNNMLEGAAPTSNILYDQWAPIVDQPLSKQGTLYKEVLYKNGPTGHYNGHTVSMTGAYTETGLNLNINPASPTIFEYYRKHSDPAQSAINAWWLSEGLGPYPSLNYSRHPAYGPAYGANYLRPLSIFNEAGFSQLGNAVNYQTDDVQRILKVKKILDNNFLQSANDLPGIKNSDENREMIKSFILQKMADAANGTMEVASPNNDYGLLTSDLVNISVAWHVLDNFAPELTVINTTNLDVCHDNFSLYLNFLHKADYGIGWLWNKIQSHPVLANDTIMICIPEHGRNLETNNLTDGNGFGAYDHTGDANSRKVFSLIVGPPDKVKQDQQFTTMNPQPECIDIAPTIAHILGFHDLIPGGMLNGRVLEEAFL